MQTTSRVERLSGTEFQINALVGLDEFAAEEMSSYVLVLPINNRDKHESAARLTTAAMILKHNGYKVRSVLNEGELFGLRVRAA